MGQMLSIVIIAFNEEQRLAACLASLPKPCEIIVLDSGSQDQTLEIARSFGALCFQRTFDDYASQKNAAVSKATGDWIFSIDADEVMSPALRQEIEDFLFNRAKPRLNAYSVTRTLVFLGKPLRFGKTRDHPVRFFRRGGGSFKGEIHERVVIEEGAVGTLGGTLLHSSYKDLSDYFSRFNRYTSFVAANHHRLGRRAPLAWISALRFWFEFISRFVFRLGFLDGLAGYEYALLSSVYAYVKYEKLRELEQSKQS